jgi:FtsP/CotA-like multicopper oxidase with cupredoxin domain
MNRQMRVLFAAVLIGSAVVMLPRIVSSRERARELRIVVRDMTYYVDGVKGPNPALRFTPGEQVRVVLRNEDKGMSHDFSIPAWGVGTKVLQGAGQESVTFRVPANAAAGIYSCTPHSAMMSGEVILQ